MKVFSVRDMKSEAFLQPYFSPTPGAALRAFGDACAKSDSPFYVHPNDYVLFEIGCYDDSDGLITAVVPVKMMACAADFVEKRVPLTPGVTPIGVAEGENHGS